MVGRSRVYASSAERQRAYRERLAGRRVGALPPVARRQRPPSRPARLAAIQEAVLKLFEEYEDWLASLPESLQESEQGQRVSETVDQLAAVIDLLADIELPRGFGRD